MTERSELTWYLLRRHQTLDRNFSKRVSSIQLYRYNSSWTHRQNMTDGHAEDV